MIPLTLESACLAYMKPLVWSPAWHKPEMMAHMRNPDIPEMDAGGSEVQGHLCHPCYILSSGLAWAT